MTMTKWKRELLASARSLGEGHLAQHPVFSPSWDELTVILAGSAAADYADRYSGIDLVALAPEEHAAELQTRLEKQHGGGGPDRDGFYSMTVGPRRVKVKVQSLPEARALLADYDDYAMLTYVGAPLVHDPAGRFPELVSGVDGYPGDVLAEKLADRYRRFRARRASIAWNLRRGQPFAVLDNLTQLVDHALSMCFLMEGRPPVGRKWLLQEGLRTPAGRKVRGPLFQLFSGLGQLAVLGGSLRPRRNELYRLIAEIQEALEGAAADAGMADAFGDEG